MITDKIMAKLAKPFSANEVDWRLQNANETRGLAVPYLDARAVARRLDEVFGVFGWQDRYTPWHTIGNKSSQVCEIFIYCKESKEWISKSDGAENSDIEAIKGGLSDSFKRAAVKWGIGRYLYQLEPEWVDVEVKNGKKYMKKGESAKLNNVYNEAIAKLLQAQPKQTPEQPSNTGNSETAPPTQEQPQTPAPPAGPKSVKGLTLTIKSVEENNSASGTNTKLVVVESMTKKTYTVYLRGVHPELGEGMCLVNVTLTEHNGTHGTFMTVDKHEIYQSQDEVA